MTRLSKLPFVAVFLLAIASVVISHAQKRGGGKNPVAPPPDFDASEVKLRYFSDAREHLKGERPKYGGAIAKSGRSTPQARSTEGAGDSSDASDGFVWSKLIDRETIEDEIKKLKLQVDKTITAPSPFKGGGNRDAQKQFSMLAMLFAIAAEYDGDVRWKKEAPGLRELFARVGFNCKVGTDQSFKEAKARKFDLSDLVGGSQISVSSADRRAVWDKVALRAVLMKRLEDSFDKKLQPWMSSKKEFSKNVDAVRHEAQLVAAIAEVIQRENFEFWDDDDYLGYSRQMGEAAQAIAEGAKLDNFDAASAGASQIKKSCSECHESYRS